MKLQKQKMCSTPFAPLLCHAVVLNHDSSLRKQTVIVFSFHFNGNRIDPRLLNYKCCPCLTFPLTISDDLSVCKCPVCSWNIFKLYESYLATTKDLQVKAWQLHLLLLFTTSLSLKSPITFIAGNRVESPLLVVSKMLLTRLQYNSCEQFSFLKIFLLH